MFPYHVPGVHVNISQGLLEPLVSALEDEMGVAKDHA